MSIFVAFVQFVIYGEYFEFMVFLMCKLKTQSVFRLHSYVM